MLSTFPENLYLQVNQFPLKLRGLQAYVMFHHMAISLVHFVYSNHPKTGHPNTGFIWIPDFLVSGIQMLYTIWKPDIFVPFSNGFGPQMSKWWLTIQKPDFFVRFSNGLGPQMSKYHLKTGQKCVVFE